MRQDFDTLILFSKETGKVVKRKLEVKQLSVSLVRQGHKANKRVRGVGMGLEEEKKLFFLSKKKQKGKLWWKGRETVSLERT